MKKIYLVVSLISTNIVNINAQNWTQVWADEFNATSVSTANWVFETGNNNGWGNSELENYTNKVDNAVVKNGQLNIIAKKESFGGFNYTSARMKTQGLQSWTYGKIEANIKIPTGKGIWPAFWMLGSNINTKNWPACGEIDIMEHINTEPTLYGTIHWADANSQHVQYGGSTTIDTKKFNLYGIEWDNTAIRWYINGVKYHEANINNSINNTEEFHLPFFIILNLAVGGQWPGNPDATTVYPDTMQVDYIRVYKNSVTNINDVSITHNFSIYPNPVTDKSNVNYTLQNTADVTIKLYDVIGNEVMPAVNQTQTAGDHQLKIPSHIKSGIYIIKGSIDNHPFYYKFLKE